MSIIYIPFFTSYSYEDLSDEPNSTDRVIEFTIFDDIFLGSDSITLAIVTVDDNPTRVGNLRIVDMLGSWSTIHLSHLSYAGDFKHLNQSICLRRGRYCITSPWITAH